jgi:alpha-amylase
VKSSVFDLCFSLFTGGSLYELDFKPANINLLDVLTRREEGYHMRLLEKQSIPSEEAVASIHNLVLAKEEGLEKYLTYDWYRRGSLIDHFLGEPTKLEDFSQCRYPEQGDFVNQPYHHKIEKKKDELILTLYRDGFVWSGEKRAPVTVAKSIALKPQGSQLDISYTLINNHSERVNLWFGIEFGLAVPSDDDDIRFCYVGENQSNGKAVTCLGNVARCMQFGLRDGYLKVDTNFKLNRQSQLWRFPVYTVSLSEAGFEKVQQSLVLFPHWKFFLEPQEKWEVKIENSFNLLK